MTLLERVAECDNWNPAHFVPFRVDRGHGAGTEPGPPPDPSPGPRSGTAPDPVLGWVRHDLLDALALHADVLTVDGRGVTLRAEYTDFEERTRAMQRVVAELSRGRRLLPLAHERYPVAERPGDPPLLALERAALPAFGVLGHGVHLNGFVRGDDGIRLWIARRARNKPTYPGQLDNMVAGGQPMGLSLRQNLAKECAEEADIPPELAARATASGRVSYHHEYEWGLKHDVLFLYELELPEDFVPRAVDGEVEDFQLWPMSRVLATVEQTREFKFNCPLAILHFALRHGALDPGHSEHAELSKLLDVCPSERSPQRTGQESGRGDSSTPSSSA